MMGDRSPTESPPPPLLPSEATQQSTLSARTCATAWNTPLWHHGSCGRHSWTPQAARGTNSECSPPSMVSPAARKCRCRRPSSRCRSGRGCFVRSRAPNIGARGLSGRGYVLPRALPRARGVAGLWAGETPSLRSTPELTTRPARWEGGPGGDMVNEERGGLADRCAATPACSHLRRWTRSE